ncbi:aldo/keto reductase [Mesobacillus subterraneus]|uniref:aldo/keto reductase n=1 Tax=Mesobacillus subterraneus TaxID=285983 RepID=UPI00203C6D3B|nr:aldo/keto reductase [Mesobacillus subterraneus]MCM3665173.1 aldo/keto reductase [Mesobacillus subterraneus]MCM3684186.1 aldo/keto reductase [Mesobacillus subterraneus]
MNYRQLGSTGIKVSEVGFGAWQLGNARDWEGMEDNQAIRLVHEALDHECNFFDTAPNYGGGKSESLLGRALTSKRSEAVINSKFGHHPDNTLNFDPQKIRSSVEDSLRRLKMDYLDSVLLHNPPFEILTGSTDHFEVLESLKQEGKIRAYGASVDSAREMEELILNTGSQVIEVMFNIFHQEPRKAFKMAAEKNVGLIVKVPLDSGWLSGKYDESSVFTDIRSRWDQDQLTKRAELLPVLKEMLEPGESLVQMALRYILYYQEVSTVIPGNKNLEQLMENISASGKRISVEKAKKLEELWEEKLQADPLGW